MKITHTLRCFTDRLIYGSCKHDSKTGKRVPFDVNVKVDPQGEKILRENRCGNVVTTEYETYIAISAPFGCRIFDKVEGKNYDSLFV